MRILLVQNLEYLYYSGGAHKANRLLMELLSARGHSCSVVTYLSSDYRSFRAAAAEYGISGEDLEETDGYFRYVYNGVTVYTCKKEFFVYSFIRDLSRIFEPELVMVTEDHTGLLMEICLEMPYKVIYLAHTQATLPFGGGDILGNEQERGKLFEKLDGIITVSRFMRNYIFTWGDIEARALYFPSYSNTQIRQLGSFHNRYVTIINPSGLKGIDIFAETARQLPQLEFAAVAGWATSEGDLKVLSQIPNVTLLKAEKEINKIFAQTRILMVPSLWEEAFGQIIVEAQLSGIPVLSSDVGGIPEAKCGTDYIIPVQKIEKYNGTGREKGFPEPVVPEQETGDWINAIKKLTSDETAYETASKDAMRCAGCFVDQISITDFEEYFKEILAAPVNSRRWENKQGGIRNDRKKERQWKQRAGKYRAE